MSLSSLPPLPFSTSLMIPHRFHFFTSSFSPFSLLSFNSSFFTVSVFYSSLPFLHLFHFYISSITSSATSLDPSQQHVRTHVGVVVFGAHVRAPFADRGAGEVLLLLAKSLLLLLAKSLLLLLAKSLLLLLAKSFFRLKLFVFSYFDI